MPAQKSKVTRSRRGMRRSHDAIERNPVHTCENCGSLKRPHRVCVSCGYYKGKEIIAPRA